jgi:hypothetical protein
MFTNWSGHSRSTYNTASPSPIPEMIQTYVPKIKLQFLCVFLSWLQCNVDAERHIAFRQGTPAALE